ncbi:MAG: amidohydrolase family protein [Ferruginibacter sp.]|nr:amidohydrolase family protein [Ferruginibacter sp.]
MAYRKIKANKIFDGYTFLETNKVLITQANGIIETIVDVKDAGDDIQNFNGIICPGFINAHCHIELSHLKNKIPQQTGLVEFILQILKYRNADEDIKQHAMQLADQELYNTGTVAVGDICNTNDSLSLKKHSKIHWHNFIEVSGFNNDIAETRFEIAKNIYEQFCKLSLSNSIVPHAPYSVSTKLFNLINQSAIGKTLCIHNQETLTENEFFQDKIGGFLHLYESLGVDITSFLPLQKTSLQYWLPQLKNAKKIIAVHNTFTTQADINFVKNKKTEQEMYFCLCPNANLYIENTVPAIDLLIKNQVNIVLGTDSYASNTQLNIFEEIKTIQKYFPNIPLQNILKWATINGAKALEINDKFGSFEKGKIPGIVLINNEKATRIL